VKRKKEQESLPESRFLELNAYLTKPIVRLSRYPLLLEAVLKYTSKWHTDQMTIPEAVKAIRAFLAQVNYESGRTQDWFDLGQLDQQLIFKPHERAVRAISHFLLLFLPLPGG
jgi:hypothetical protein